MTVEKNAKKAERKRNRYHQNNEYREKCLNKSKSQRATIEYKDNRKSAQYKEKRLIRLSKPHRLIAAKLKRNSIERKLYMVEYRKTEKYRTYHTNRARNKFKDIKYRISKSMSASIRQCLLKNKAGRHWEDLVGYNINELRAHLESLWSNGMTWENYGKWHIDHIIPLSLWFYCFPEDNEFKQCWSLANLQPLWAFDNLSKKDKCILVENK